MLDGLLEAAALMGMSESEFYETSPRFFAARQRAWQRQQQEGWEQARYIGWLCIQPHIDTKRRIKITDLGRFPWEELKKPVFEPVDKAKMDKFRQDAIAIIERRNGVKLKKDNGDN